MTAPASATVSPPAGLAVLPRLPAVVTDPPYDDELPAAGSPLPFPAPRTGATPLGSGGTPLGPATGPLGSASGSLGPATAKLEPAATSPAAAGAAAPGAVAASGGAVRPTRVPTQPQDSRFHESPRAAAALVVRALVEVLSGLRPVGHLAGWTTYPLQSALERYGGWFQGGTALRSMRVSEPRPGAAEVSAVVSRGDRAAAIALRMEAKDGRWRVTALHLG